MPDTNNQSLLNLYYVLDPMCSWCWAFRESWQALLEVLPDDVAVRYVLGGLAPDSEQPMPEAMQQSIRQTWMGIAARTGASFNMEFWDKNTPRRSTYPACRAVITAARLRPGALPEMVYAIQRAYYLEAKNPSDQEVLLDCAESLGFDRGVFTEELSSESVQHDFNKNLHLSRLMGIQGFPSVLAVSRQKDGDKPSYHSITAGYCDPSTLVSNWHQHFPQAA